MVPLGPTPPRTVTVLQNSKKIRLRILISVCDLHNPPLHISLYFGEVRVAAACTLLLDVNGAGRMNNLDNFRNVRKW